MGYLVPHDARVGGRAVLRWRDPHGRSVQHGFGSHGRQERPLRRRASTRADSGLLLRRLFFGLRLRRKRRLQLPKLGFGLEPELLRNRQLPRRLRLRTLRLLFTQRQRSLLRCRHDRPVLRVLLSHFARHLRRQHRLRRRRIGRRVQLQCRVEPLVVRHRLQAPAPLSARSGQRITLAMRSPTRTRRPKNSSSPNSAPLVRRPGSMTFASTSDALR